MTETIFLLRRQMEQKLSASRYEHSLSVSYISTALAMRYGYSLEKAETAGILHDCAKRYREEVLIQKCEKHGILLTQEERNAPSVIHAKYGAWMAEHKFGIEDEEILSAIRYHTTGRPHMSLWEKILFTADYIEPRRNQVPDLSELRSLAFLDLDRTVYTILEHTLQYLESQKASEDPMTRAAYEYYRVLFSDTEKKEEIL